MTSARQSLSSLGSALRKVEAFVHFDPQSVLHREREEKNLAVVYGRVSQEAPYTAAIAATAAAEETLKTRGRQRRERANPRQHHFHV